MLWTAATDDDPGLRAFLHDVEAMDLLCVCGARMPYLFDALDCPTCGRAC